MSKKGRNRFAATVIAAITMALTSAGALAGGFLDLKYEEATFTNPLIIDNPYWPLRPNAPGVLRKFTYVGETEDECVIDIISIDDGSHTLGVTTYTLNGAAPYTGHVTVQVVDIEWVFEELGDGEECDLDLLDGEDADDAIQELTFDWYRQDDQQNVWYMGEASRDFDAAEIDGEEVDCPDLDAVPLGSPIGAWGSDELFYECTGGSWEAGMDGDPDPDETVIGQAGVVVPGDFPILGESLTAGTYYMQEVAFEAEDMAKILKLNGSVDEAYPDETDYEECRKVKEWNPFEHGGSVEHKWYCAGPGLVLIEGIGGGKTEVEELVDIDPLLP